MELKSINNDSILTEEKQIIERLKKVGIPENILLEATSMGTLSKSNCTIFDTKGKPGYIQWNDTNSTLRSLTKNKGWKTYQEGGIEGIISEDGRIRIIPSSGNAATGNPNQPASNKNRKGEGCIKMFKADVQGDFWHGFPEIIDDMDEVETFVLLYYNDDKELRTELSKPSFIDSKGKIKTWEERIILKSQKLNDPNPTVETEPNVEINVPVERKQIKAS